MRTGVAIGVLCAGCSFQIPAGGAPDDARPIDGAVGDGAPGDGAPDAPVVPAARRKPIVIQAARVTGAHTSFPVWIDLTDAELQARASATGADLYFTDAGGAALAYEIQGWTPATGRLTAWVRLPQLASNANTTIYLRYGDPTGVPAASGSATFSNAFAAVWHMDDPLTTPAITDATGTRMGATEGGLGPGDQVMARLGGGIDFDGVDDQITFTNPLAGGGAHTISAWVNARTASTFDTIMIVGNPATNQSRWLHARYYPGTVAYGFYGNDRDNAGTTIENAGWVLLHWVFEGPNRMSRLYRDGVVVDNHMHAMGVNTQGAGGFLGNGPVNWGAGGNTVVALNGILDEVRIATVARTAAWVATEHANQSAPATFYTVGAEQAVP